MRRQKISRSGSKTEKLNSMPAYMATVAFGWACFGISCIAMAPERMPAQVVTQIETFAITEAEDAEAEIVIDRLYEITPDDLEKEQDADALELLACVAEAEAGNQSRDVKRLCIDVALNRVEDESGLWPGSLWDVLFQDGQFTTVENGAAFRTTPAEETYEAVRSETDGERLNTRYVYFNSLDTPPAYQGVTWVRHGDMWFGYY